VNRDDLAAHVHSAWSGWMDYLFKQSLRNPDGTFTIPVWAVERWKRQARTPYAELPQAEKAGDLDEADRILKIVAGF